MLPRSWRHRIWTLAGTGWQSAYARQLIARPAPARPFSPQAPLVVAGLFNTANGIGEGARATYRALEAAGLNPIAVDLSEPFAPVDMQTNIRCQPMPSDREGTLILQLNGPETMSAMQHLGLQRGRNWYTIGYWAWELPTFPFGWETAFQYLSEIWTISTFAASALNAHPKAPNISIFGHAVTPADRAKSSRSKFGWSEEDFVFLTMADSMSSLERKNPFAAIRVFRSAFGDAADKKLIVKTRNLDRNAEAHERLMEEIDGAQNIQVLDVSLGETDLWSLLKSADALISFHRSEGFGLTMAEAMAVSKPVICTNWSGNTDFTAPETAALTNYKLVPCSDPFGVYSSSTARWAEVDEEHGRELLIRVAEDKDYREALVKNGQQKIADVASVEHIGRRMAEHLAALPISKTANTGLIR